MHGVVTTRGFRELLSRFIAHLKIHKNVTSLNIWIKLISNFPHFQPTSPLSTVETQQTQKTC